MRQICLISRRLYCLVGRRYPCGSGIGALLVPLPGVRGLSSAGEEVDNRLE